MNVIWAFAVDFLVCELGQWAANQYEAFNDELSSCAWYSLPIDMQRLYWIFLLDTQQPLHVQSYGSIVCSRETFKKVRCIFNRQTEDVPSCSISPIANYISIKTNACLARISL